MILYLLFLIPITAALAIFRLKKIAEIEAVAFFAVLIEVACIARIIQITVSIGAYRFAPFFVIDAMGAIILMIIATVGFAGACYSVGYIREEIKKQIIGLRGLRRVRQYYALFHIFLFSMFLAVSASNLILMWIAIEATTLSTAFLISFYNRPAATEAAWKYILLNSAGLLLGFLGTIIFVAIASHNELRALALDPMIPKVAFILILVGYGTKVGLAPMHTWRPDAYDKAPAPIVGLFSGALLNVAFLAILRFKGLTDAEIGPLFSANLLIFFGLCSLVVAGLTMLAQQNYKRLLAYSSIEHAGIMALGFGLGGTAVLFSVLHMIYHALAKSLLFFAAGNIFLRYSTATISEIKGVIRRLPITGVLFFAGFLIVIGIPPFGMFYTEFHILASAMERHIAIAIIAFGAIILAFIGFFSIILRMLFEDDATRDTGAPGTHENLYLIAPLLFLFMLLIICSISIPPFLGVLLNNISI